MKIFYEGDLVQEKYSKKIGTIESKRVTRSSLIYFIKWEDGEETPEIDVNLQLVNKLEKAYLNKLKVLLK